MLALTRVVVRHRGWVLAVWLLLAAVGGYAAPRAVEGLSYEFGLPGQAGYETNRQILELTGSGGENPPLLLVVGDGSRALDPAVASALAEAIGPAVPGARVVSYADEPGLVSVDGTTGVVLIHPVAVPGPDPFVEATPALTEVAAQVSERTGTPVVLTGDLPLRSSEGGAQENGVLADVLIGGVGALLVLLLVFGSALALTPLIIAAGSILTTFLVVWGLTGITDVSFIVQFLLALIGLGVAIDYALLVVTRWREELAAGADRLAAVDRAMSTAGRSVLFSGLTVAVSLAALIALPVPFLRSVGFTGLLIPLVSVLAALTLLPALLATVGERLLWPRRRQVVEDGEGRSVSRLWERIGRLVVRHRWVAAVGATLVLLALATPLLGLRLGQPTADALGTGEGPAAAGLARLETAGLPLGLLHPVEILTTDPDAARATADGVDGVAGSAAPPDWAADGQRIVDAWTVADTATAEGGAAAERLRAAVDAAVGGTPAQDADFLSAVYGNAAWVVGVIVLVTFLLLARALRSIWLPVKALVLNVLSLGAAYGVTVLVWQEGYGSELVFGQPATGAITVWIPIAVFAFLFGLSMDYEVFLLARMREEYDAGHGTDEAIVRGLARTGRLVTSAALILFFSFVSLSTVPEVDVKVLATALALGILIDATIVRGVLAPALVAVLGRANWSYPRWAPGHTDRPSFDPAGDGNPPSSVPVGGRAHADQ